MNTQRLYFLAALFAALPVQADVMYQCVDDSGHKSFSNVKSSAKGTRCKVMDLGPAVAAPAPKAAVKAPTPSDFPKVNDSAQKARDTDRRRILEAELAAEQKSLDEARKTLAEQETSVLPGERTQGGGVAGGKVGERVQPLRDKVALHERNIAAIQKEIAKLP